MSPLFKSFALTSSLLEGAGPGDGAGTSIPAGPGAAPGAGDGSGRGPYAGDGTGPCEIGNTGSRL